VDRGGLSGHADRADEYKWGADDSPSGALAQAELLAILAREGVDLATRWVVPESGSKTEEAFRFWLGYDGAGAKVQGESVRATTSDVDAVGAYAVRSPRDELFVLLFNKDDEARQVNGTLAAAVAGAGALWRFDAGSPLAPAGSLPVAAGAFSITLPARSATLARFALAGGASSATTSNRARPGAGARARPDAARLLVRALALLVDPLDPLLADLLGELVDPVDELRVGGREVRAGDDADGGWRPPSCRSSCRRTSGRMSCRPSRRPCRPRTWRRRCRSSSRRCVRRRAGCRPTRRP